MKQHTDGQRPSAPPRTGRDFDLISLLTLAGVIAVLMIAFSSMRDLDRLDRSLGERIAKLEGQVAQLAARPAQPAPAGQKGLDPNRVYTVRVAADAPARGPANAPVTIALFSDFQ
jgi:hypothetical protein